MTIACIIASIIVGGWLLSTAICALLLSVGIVERGRKS
jgi:hypothetical protein